MTDPLHDAEEILQRFRAAGQEQLFDDWEELTEREKANLLGDCRLVDFDWVEARRSQLREEEAAGAAAPAPDSLIPAPVVRLPETPEERAAEAEARRAGEEAIRRGETAAFLVAGGQGTRLGYDGPKGCYPIGPATKRTLFQWHAEQIRARARRHGVTIPWYVMTGPTNDAATRQTFRENAFFGFAEEDVFIFQQGVVPTLDFEGNLFRAAKDRLALNPDGHGGSLAALVRSGAAEDMRRRGIRWISYFQVDNPLVTIPDSVYLGHHIRAEAEMSSKVVRKNAPEEKVGIVCIADGTLRVIEYSDLDEETMNARDEAGDLRFWAGSIAIHVLSVDFVDRVGGEASLPWHIARKKVPRYAEGRISTPEKPNAVKFEQFVFDALPRASGSVTLEVLREAEFAPTKNATGIDSVETTRALLSNRFAGWLSACGRHLPRETDGETGIPVEISPLYALDAEELSRRPLPDAAGAERIVLA